MSVWKLGSASVLCIALAGYETPVSSAPDHSAGNVAVGETFKPCETCLEFVRMPDAPSDLRPIRFVAKYPLTWNQYLASVEDGACPAPSQSVRPFGRELRAADYIEELRIDWPVPLNTTSEVTCFTEWLASKASLHVAVPTEDEWNWFALGDRTDAKNPWGDDETNPPAAVPGVEIDQADRFHMVESANTTWFAIGVRVGLFPPNTWGLYDVIGNADELTSTIYTGEQWDNRKKTNESRQRPERYRRTLAFDRAVAKGGDAYSSRWTRGMRGDPAVVLIKDGRYSHPLTVRYVLLGDP